MKHYATIAALLSVASAIPAGPAAAKLLERSYGGNTCACAPPAPTESKAMSSAAMAMSSSAASMMSAYSSMSSVSAMSSFAQSGCPAPSVIYVTPTMSTPMSTPASTAASTPMSSASKDMSSASAPQSSAAASSAAPSSSAAASSAAPPSSAKASSSAAASSAPASSTVAAPSSCPSSASAQATGLTNSITNLASKLQALDSAINNFKAGDFSGAIAIQNAAGDVEKALTSADDSATSASTLSDCDSQFISEQVTNLVPEINTVIKDLIAAKPKFCNTDAGGLNSEVVSSLQTQKMDSDKFSKDVTAKLSSQYASAAPAVTNQIDSEFSKAISSYQASC
ncbi:hypothetical protein K490DRAFT_55962 [Saccharata proteae CBS 121410]|uniref:Uncharacterized protein n=1 Tax=Saccharata proteae CBS 121410 TaxID=1314787 RepID=A0A9P4M155_9PEZI|nr:hypothetical protein K490DRAFT_55962 [Saccharata proteae CBS 121410]